MEAFKTSSELIYFIQIKKIINNPRIRIPQPSKTLVIFYIMQTIVYKKTIFVKYIYHYENNKISTFTICSKNT